MAVTIGFISFLDFALHIHISVFHYILDQTCNATNVLTFMAILTLSHLMFPLIILALPLESTNILTIFFFLAFLIFHLETLYMCTLMFSL